MSKTMVAIVSLRFPPPHEEGFAADAVDEGEAALEQDGSVKSDDGVDAGHGIAEEDDAGQQEGSDVFAPEQRPRLLFLRAGLSLGLGHLLHLADFDIGLFGGRERRSAVRAALNRPLRKSQRGDSVTKKLPTTKRIPGGMETQKICRHAWSLKAKRTAAFEARATSSTR